MKLFSYSPWHFNSVFKLLITETSLFYPLQVFFCISGRKKHLNPFCTWDIEILDWFRVDSVLPHGKKVPFNLDWLPFYWWCHNKNSLSSRCFITSTSLAPHLFLLCWLKLNLILFYCQINWDWPREMNTGGSFDYCRCWSFLAFSGLLSWGYRNRCFLVALCRLIVRRLNLEVATKRLLH